MIDEFHWPVRVYYEDTDAGGVVYHANYLKFFERARTEFLRRLGWNQQELLKKEVCAFVVSELSIRYKRQTRRRVGYPYTNKRTAPSLVCLRSARLSR